MSTRLAQAGLTLAVAFACVAFPVAAQEANELDRTRPPAPLSPRAIAFPEFVEFSLPNGLSVMVVEDDGLPIVNATLYIRSGEAVDPPERAGRASLVADLLTQGTPTRTASEIAEEIESVGGRLNAGAGNDWLSASMSVVRDEASLGFELLSDVVLNPTFPEEEVDAIRRRRLSGLQAQLGQPAAIASRRFSHLVYGDHPYGASATPESVGSLDREDLVGFHRRHFAPTNALLVVSGAVTQDEVRSYASRYFGRWTGTAPAQLTFPRIERGGETHVHLVHRPGSVQSNIFVGHSGVEPGHPDHFALQVLNKILGQGSDARLFQILREQRGWTYGAYSRFTRPADVGAFSASTQVRTEVTDSTVVEIMHQLRRLRDEPIPASEFQDAVDFLVGSFPLRIETPGAVAGQVAQARLLGLSPEDVTMYRERILQVTPADVRRVALEHIRPDAATIVVVGDATEVLDGLRSIAQVTLYDVEGQVISERDL